MVYLINMDYYDYYDEYEDEGISFTTPLLISIALGIYLVYTRYHSIQNRAIPYKIPIPKVYIHHSLDLNKSDQYDRP